MMDLYTRAYAKLLARAKLFNKDYEDNEDYPDDGDNKSEHQVIEIDQNDFSNNSNSISNTSDFFNHLVVDIPTKKLKIEASPNNNFISSLTQEQEVSPASNNQISNSSLIPSNSSISQNIVAPELSQNTTLPQSNGHNPINNNQAHKMNQILSNNDNSQQQSTNSSIPLQSDFNAQNLSSSQNISGNINPNLLPSLHPNFKNPIPPNFGQNAQSLSNFQNSELLTLLNIYQNSNQGNLGGNLSNILKELPQYNGMGPNNLNMYAMLNNNNNNNIGHQQSNLSPMRALQNLFGFGNASNSAFYQTMNPSLSLNNLSNVSLPNSNIDPKIQFLMMMNKSQQQRDNNYLQNLMMNQLKDKQLTPQTPSLPQMQHQIQMQNYPIMPGGAIPPHLMAALMTNQRIDLNSRMKDKEKLNDIDLKYEDGGILNDSITNIDAKNEKFES